MQKRVIIPAFEKYSITSSGRVYSYQKSKVICMKPCIVGSGYYRVILRNCFGSKQFYIHKLVADAFLKKVEGKNLINHMDGDKLNNHVSNLEWCNFSENMKHAYRTGLIIPAFGENKTMSKLTEKQVLEIKAKYIPYKMSFQKLANKYGVSRHTIGSIISGVNWSYLNK